MAATLLRRVRTLAAVLIAAVGLAGCEIIADIFEVGFWVGVILVILVIVAIWLIVRMFD
ncbi:MAG: hypothetical protein ACODAE_04315 [Gemmatimonadota bacterium]